MGIHRLTSTSSNQSQSVETDQLVPQDKTQPKEKNPSGLTAGDQNRPALDPQGRQNSSVRETSLTNTTLKGELNPIYKKEPQGVEKAFIRLKDAGDHSYFKHVDNLFTGNKAGFTQADAIPRARRLNKEERHALTEEIAGNIGLFSKKSWDVGRGVVSGISSASKLDALKDSVAGAPLNTAAVSGVTGINTAFAGIAVLKSSAELVRDLTLDGFAHKDRATTQALLKNYDPKTGVFTDPTTGKPVSDEDNQKLTAQLKELIGKKGSDRSRTAVQIAGDRLSTIRDTATSGATVVNTALTLAGAAAKVTPGLSQALSAVSATKSTWQATTNIVALNNIQHAAKQAKGDELLQAIAAHVSQERVYNSRKNLVSAAVNFTAVGVGAAALAAGPGAPAALAVASIVTTAATTALGLGITAFELGHAYQLSERRKEGSAEALASFKAAVSNDALSEANKAEAFKALADPKNIGLAERALIDRLQNGSPEEVKAAVTFLENFGLSKGTISKLKLASTEKALTALQSALYTDKVKLTLAGAKQSFSSLGKVIGISQFASFVKGKWDRFQIKRENGGFAPHESLITKSAHKGTSRLITALDLKILQRKNGKVSDEFSKLRDKYTKVPKPNVYAVKREPVRIGVDLDIDKSTWDPKTGQYNDY
jgi:hypothetical protein